MSFEHAVATDDFGQVCHDMAVPRRRSFLREADKAVRSVRSCEEAVSLVDEGRARAAARATTIERVRVNGDRAQIVLRQAGRTSPAEAVKEAGAWRWMEASG